MKVSENRGIGRVERIGFPFVLTIKDKEIDSTLVRKPYHTLISKRYHTLISKGACSSVGEYSGLLSGGSWFDFHPVELLRKAGVGSDF